MKSRHLLVFDMDGVIIDVSGSYRDTVRQTAKLFFNRAISWDTLPDPLFELSDLAEVKQRGGLNNDWDLTCLVINLLFSMVEKPDVSEGRIIPGDVQSKGKESERGQDGELWSRYEKTIKYCDVEELAGFLRSTDRPLHSLFEKRGKIRDDSIMGLYNGDVGSGNIIKQIFQEIYLGKELFESIYGISPRIYKGDGYVKRERPLVEAGFIESLSKDHILAIATGRPKIEADYALDIFNLRRYFSVVLTLDDCIREEKRIMEQTGEIASFTKPSPFMLDTISERVKDEVYGFYYIGDMPDDMVAASRSNAGFKGIGFLSPTSDKEILKSGLLEAGADYIIENVEQLKEILG